MMTTFLWQHDSLNYERVGKNSRSSLLGNDLTIMFKIHNNSWKLEQTENIEEVVLPVRCYSEDY